MDMTTTTYHSHRETDTLPAHTVTVTKHPRSGTYTARVTIGGQKYHYAGSTSDIARQGLADSLERAARVGIIGVPPRRVALPSMSTILADAWSDR